MDLLEKIAAYVGRYVQLASDAEALVVALWVLHTWTFGPEIPHPMTTPYLYIYSAERRSGKTRLLEVIETIIRNPLRAADVTSPVLFRAIESQQSTILLDEVDAIWSGAKNEELRGLLNAGYKRGGSAYRVERFETRQFNVFGPKALAGIDNAMLPDTVRDRCIPIHMHRQNVGASQPFYSFDVEADAEALCAEISEWVTKFWPTLQANRPKPIDGISDRAFEIAMPLLQIAHGFKGMAAPTRRALKSLLTGGEEELSPQSRLLADIRDLFARNENPASMPVAAILEELNGGEKNGWNGKLLANRLRPFDIRPVTIRHKNQVVRGYRRADFVDAWSRYLD